MKKDLLDEDYAERISNESFDKSSFITNEQDQFIGMFLLGFALFSFVVYLIYSQEDSSVELSITSTLIIFSIIAALIISCLLYFYSRFCESKSIYTLRYSSVVIEEPYKTYEITFESIKYVLMHRYTIESRGNSLLSSKKYFRIELGLKHKIKYSFLGIPIKKKKVFLGPFHNEPAMMNEIRKRAGLV